MSFLLTSWGEREKRKVIPEPVNPDWSEQQQPQQSQQAG
jgi:hypothetical protein